MCYQIMLCESVSNCSDGCKLKPSSDTKFKSDI